VIAVVLAYGAAVAAQAPQTPPAPALMRPADIGKLPMPPADHIIT